MDQPKYWNHNTAYYPWIREHVSGCHSILDVGCGDGSLTFYLDDVSKDIVGIDVEEICIEKASRMNCRDNTEFICCGFEDYDFERCFDAIIFVASIHHMDMKKALSKAKTLLTPGGKILIVGLAKPSTAADHLLEAVRVIPSKAISMLHHMKSTEEIGIPVSYDLPPMRDVRKVIGIELPGAKIRYGLHYRYLLEWTV